METQVSYKMKQFIISILAASLLIACGSQEGARAPLPGTVGPRGEVLVVCSQQVWNGAVGDTVRSILTQPYTVLPQQHMETYEPMFDVVHKTEDEFNKFWKPHRNIIKLEIADRKDTQEPSVGFYKNKYASGQKFIVGKARAASALAESLALRGDDMRSIIHEAEVKRSARVSAMSVDEAIQQDLIELLGTDLIIPKGAYLIKSDTGFVWIDRQMTRLKGSNNHDVQQGFFIHTEPYNGPAQFSLQRLLDRRDSLTELFVSGPTEGSYMSVERRMIPSYEEKMFDGKFAAEIKGLWRMENDFMGGPFYSLTIHDEANARLVTVEGYTYAPYFNKRAYMREVEGIVKSVRLLNKEAS